MPAWDRLTWDFAEVHDATSPGEMISWVEGGFCPPGDEEKWARTGHTRLGGEFPVNPSGGLVARGHPVGATGLGARSSKWCSQLRGESGARQVENRAASDTRSDGAAA